MRLSITLFFPLPIQVRVRACVCVRAATQTDVLHQHSSMRSSAATRWWCGDLDVASEETEKSINSQIRGDQTGCFLSEKSKDRTQTRSLHWFYRRETPVQPAKPLFCTNETNT